MQEFLANVNVAICYRRSVCRLSVVCNVGAPYSAGWNFQQFFFAVWYLPWPSIDVHGKFYRDRPRGTPPSGGLNARGVAKCSDFHLWNAVSPKWCKMGGKLVVITNGSRIWAFDWYQNRWTWMTLNGEMALILRYFSEFGNFRGVLRKIGWQSHNYMDNLRLRCLVVNICRGTTRRPRYKFLADS